jgi:UDP-N-acetylglucosamine 2-epimerase (non-hydrolysing)
LKQNPKIQCEVCVTAQHREMLDQILETFRIVPDTDLDLMRPDQSLGDLTARTLLAVESYLKKARPDLVLVQGDTTTVFCSALASFYQQIPIGHVEAGLRTGNLQWPWPEEANRTLTSRLASIHFAPTPDDRENLIREGISTDSIEVTGNTVIDALFWALELIKKSPPEIPGVDSSTIEKWESTPMVLITGHRREHFGSAFESICRAIGDLARAFPEVSFVYPVHLNPNVRRPVESILANPEHPIDNIHLLEPLSYLPFVRLMQASTMIMTDSGGIQEEAPSLGKPVLVFREVTERTPTVSLGNAILVGPDYDRIVDEGTRILSSKANRDAMAQDNNPYGDGQAADRITQSCLNFLEHPPPSSS